MSSQTSFPAQSLSNYERGVHAAYDYIDGKTDYDKTVHRLQRLGSRALSVLGEVHLQESADNPDSSLACLDKAEEVLNERVFSDELGFDPRAAIRLAQMPLYRSLIVEKCLPSSNILAETYQSILWAATTAANHYTFRDDQTSKDGQGLLGTLSEANVLLLLERQALQTKRACLPVQSLLSEDLMASDHSRGWDISVYMINQNNELEIGEKVQVKNSGRILKKYNRDIAVVTINPDLAIAKETGIGSVEILAELQKEANPFESSNRATKRLNQRTDKLLAIIQRTK